MRNFPRSLKPFEKEALREQVCETFSITQDQLDYELLKGRNGRPKEESDTKKEAIRLESELNELIPRTGILRRYCDYTEHSEAPLAYHVFSFLGVAGAVINRRIWFDMGYYRLYPTLGIIILGPSGIKKTSATNIAVDILQKLGLVKVYSEKLTPEALIDAMKGDNAVGLVYAPEMSVFLSKAQYNEGLVQLITRFMDCPDVWESGTIGRGKSVVHNVAISSLMCSTPDWFVSSTPTDSFGGGFIARNLLVVQNSSARCEPIPIPGDPSAARSIGEELAALHSLEGQIVFDRVAWKRYDDWYRGEHQDEIKNPEHELLATYHNRKPDHLKRIAICLHMLEHGTFELCGECFTNAIYLLKWTEQFLPSLLAHMFRSPVGEMHDIVLRIIAAKQPITHSDLVREMSHRINAAELKIVIQSLKEGNRIVERIDNIGRFYLLMEE